MNVVIPKDIAAGDYLLRAEVIALHTASSLGGAQFYVTCCMPYLSPLKAQNANHIIVQLSVTGGGSAAPALVQLPGAYKAADPGIELNIHAAMATYVAPGPTVYAGGTTKSAGAVCAGVETGKTTGPAVASATKAS